MFFKSCINLIFFNLVIIILFSSTHLVYSQSYKIDYNGKSVVDNYFSPRKTFEIYKMNSDNYSENSFYLKSKHFITDTELNKLLKIILSGKGYPDLSIRKINRPFNKFQSNNLLRNNSSELGNIFQIEIENKYEIFDICSLLQETNEFEYVIPVIFYQFDETQPNDPQLSNQWALEAVGLFAAWDIAKGDGSVTIAIVDSGTDFEHEDLKQQVWTNHDEIPNDGIDNDGNGFIDDVHGWDFVGDIDHIAAIQNKFLEDNNVIPVKQSNDHGTHVAGTAAAGTNNALGIASSGYDVTFMPVKIGVDDLNKSRLVYRPYEAMLYAAMNGADVINCSWSSGIHDPLAFDVVNQLLDMDISVVAAAGNENSFFDYYPYYPAVIPGVIGVGSINQNDSKSTFSNYGVNVTCFAPGENIFATANNNRYVAKTGTSMATPLVSGIVATLKKLFPNFSNKHILKQIRSTVSSINPKTYLTHGKINAYDAFRYNNPNEPSYKTPGIGIEQILIENNDVIDSYGETNLRIILKNYLSDAVNIKVSLSPQDNYFNIIPQTSTIQSLKSNEIYNLDLKFNLDKTCPWFSGEAYIFINYESNDYNDYELISVPIRLETNNRYLLTHNFLEDIEINWLASATTGNFDFWTVGYDQGAGKGVMYNFGQLNTLSSPTNDIIFDISALDFRNIMLGTVGNDKTTKVMYSTNSGSTFTNTNTTPFLRMIKGVKMYDNLNSIVYGTNWQDLGDIIISNDGGKSFNKASYNFTFSAFEKETITSKLVVRNNISYLGTSMGRILKSSNNGLNWEIYSNWFNDDIVHIAAINDDSLFVIIEQDGLFYLHGTKNAGASFSKSNYSITDLQNTLYTFVPDSSNTVYLMDKSGKIYYSSDMGSTWNAELSSMYPFYDLYSAALYSKSGKARLWMSGADINYLDFDVIPSNIIKDVSIAGLEKIYFDTTNIFEFVEDIIFLENKGNIRSNIIEQKLSNGTNFEIVESFKSMISPAELLSATIKYKPQSTGFHYDTLTIRTDAKAEVLKFMFSGFSVDPTSINDNPNLNDGFKLINQSSGNYLLEISNSHIDNYNIKLYDLNGKIIKDYGHLSHKGNPSYLKISTDYLTQGLYILEINNDTNQYILKIPVTKF